MAALLGMTDEGLINAVFPSGLQIQFRTSGAMHKELAVQIIRTGTAAPLTAEIGPTG